MNRDLLIGGDQLRVLEQKPPQTLWRFAGVWAAAALVLVPGSCSLLPLGIDWGPYLLISFGLGLGSLLAAVLSSLLAALGGIRKSGGARRQLPLLVAVCSMALCIWAICLGISFGILHFFNDSNQLPLYLSLIFLLCGLVGFGSTLLHAWTHLLKTPLWLALPILFLSVIAFAAIHAAWSWTVMSMTYYDSLIFL